MQKKKKWHIKIGDDVRIMSGYFKNRSGEVVKINKNNGTLIIKGINLKVKNIKPTNENKIGEVKLIEAPIHHSNVQLIITDI